MEEIEVYIFIHFLVFLILHDILYLLSFRIDEVYDVHSIADNGHFTCHGKKHATPHGRNRSFSMRNFFMLKTAHFHTFMWE